MGEKKKKKEKPEEDYESNRKLLERIQSSSEFNNFCFDCDAAGPRWASINFGVFLCLRCSGIHRSLGVHISKVRSVNLDKWTLEQVQNMDRVGNKRGRELYESCVPKNHKRPTEFANDSEITAYIRAKYDKKAFFAKDITCSPGEEFSSPLSPNGNGNGFSKSSSKSKESRGDKPKTERRKKKEKPFYSDSSESESKSKNNEDKSRKRRSKKNDSSSDSDGPSRSLDAFVPRKQPTSQEVAPAANATTNDSKPISPMDISNNKLRSRGKEVQDEFMSFAPPSTAGRKQTAQAEDLSLFGL